MMDGIRSVLVAIAANSDEGQSIPVAMRAVSFAKLAGATAWACAPQFHGQRHKDGVIDASDRQVQPRNLVWGSAGKTGNRAELVYMLK
jgi:hypothetical protein